jgi:biotin carboxyl carrier protein
MNKTYTINNSDVVISQQADNLLVNGKPISAQIIYSNGAEVKILLGDQVITYEVKEKYATQMRLLNHGEQFLVDWQAAGSANPIPNKPEVEPALKVVKAPLPGVVMKLVAAIGQTIKKNDVVLVIESMKMQIDVRSNFEGVLKSLLVKTGDQLEVDSVIAEID